MTDRRTRARRAAGELEAEVLSVLWAADGPMVPAEVQAAVGGRLAYTTVLTILSRLHDKGVLRRTRAGRAHAYEAVLDAPGIAARRMRSLLEGRGDRAAVLSRFVAGLEGDDETALVEALRAARATRPGRS